MDSETKIRQEYDKIKPRWDALAEEVEYIIRNVIGNEKISISEVSVRVKTLSSVIKKIKDKDYKNIERVTDFVGARVICLFRNDLDFLKKCIEDNFNVIEVDEKDLSNPDSFGYMSIHYQCSLRDDCRGPRYDQIKSISFEIQLRTICMHAWSAVQHALDYKGAWDVPHDLKKDINALSAIFYLADTQFSSVYQARKKAIDDVLNIAESQDIRLEELNLDTLHAYAARKFPEKHLPPPSDFSDLVQELIMFEYKTIDQLDNDIEKAKNSFNKEDNERDRPFNAIGAIRVSITHINHKYKKYIIEKPVKINKRTLNK